MSLVYADRVMETTITAGTGGLSLAGAVLGYQTFSSGVGVGNTCYYAAHDPTTGDWEVGLGTLSDTTTLDRTAVLASSNGGAAVSFAANAKFVFVDVPASVIANLGAGLPSATEAQVPQYTSGAWAAKSVLSGRSW